MAHYENDQGLEYKSNPHRQQLREELDDVYEYVETSSLNSPYVTYIPGRVRIDPPKPPCSHESVVAVYGSEYDEFFMQNPVAHICTECDVRLP